MKTDERKSHWDRIYSEKQASEMSWFQSEPTLSLRFIHESGVGREASILDVGAGESSLVDRLLAEGYSRLAILDVSGKALAKVGRRLGDGLKQIEFFEKDVTEFMPPHAFQLWHDRAVFHFLTDAADRRRYVNALERTLEPGGHLILASFAVGGPMRCSGLDVVRYNSEKLLGELGSGFRLIEERIEDHATPAGGIHEFAYFRLRRAT